MLNKKQRAILNCIYLKHHNGYVRQRNLEELDKIYDYWVTPFTFHLLGDYVFEILEVLEKQADDYVLKNYRCFEIENPRYGQTIESRMINYWHIYYRSNYPKFGDYPGRRIFDRIREEQSAIE